MIKFPAATFKLGPPFVTNTTTGLKEPDLECGGTSTPEIEHCDSGKQAIKDRLFWIADLTWVPAATATVKSFWIDEHEVTNLHYLACVESGACTPPAFEEVAGVRYFGNPEYDDYPVVFVSRQQAEEYCTFVNKRLPTEAQWERAARLGPGGVMRTYPWDGDTPSTCSVGNSRYVVARGCAQMPLPVNYSDSDKTYYDVRNMASNVSEWVRDDWHPYAYCKDRQPLSEDCQKKGVSCADCGTDGTLCAWSCDENLLVICKPGTYSVYTSTSSTERVVRGGSYQHSRCFHRLFVRRLETTARPEIGFRCAR